MSTLKMYDFRVTNPVTKETAKFLGQGETLAEALKDGAQNIGHVYRPKTDSRKQIVTTLAVRLPSGQIVNRLVKDFEGETPYQP